MSLYSKAKYLRTSLAEAVGLKTESNGGGEGQGTRRETDIVLGTHSAHHVQQRALMLSRGYLTIEPLNIARLVNKRKTSEWVKALKVMRHKRTNMLGVWEVWRIQPAHVSATSVSSAAVTNQSRWGADDRCRSLSSEVCWRDEDAVPDEGL